MPKKQNKQKKGSRRPNRGRGSTLPTPWEDLKATGRTAARSLVFLKGAANLLNAEIKYMDTGNAVSSSSTPAIIYLSGCAQGDGPSDRDGNSIKLKGGLIRLLATANSSASRTTQRIMLIADTRCEKANPTITDVVDVARPTGLLNLAAYPNRFVVLHDEFFVIGTTTGAGLNSWWRTLDFSALIDAHINYTGSGATAATCGQLGVFMIHWNNEATNTSTINYDSRFYFVDN